MYQLNQKVREQTAEAAVNNAIPLVDKALVIVGRANAGESNDEEYFQRWFGTPEDHTGVVEKTYGQVKDLLNDSLTIRDANNKMWSKCSDGVLAYSQHNKKTVNICERFYQKSAQEQAETIVHELTHIAVDTEDYDGPGEEQALERARGKGTGDPKNCAYNYEYFAKYSPAPVEDDDELEELEIISEEPEVLIQVAKPVEQAPRERLFTMPVDKDEKSEIWLTYHTLNAKKQRLQTRGKTNTSEYMAVTSRLDKLWWKYGIR